MKTTFSAFLIIFSFIICHAQESVKTDTIIAKDSSNIKMIRCHASIKSDDRPLLIIDGVVSGWDDDLFKDLDPESIKSADFIKNAPTIFCGGKAARNGIFAITTSKSTNQGISLQDVPFKIYTICNNNWNLSQDIYNDLQAQVPGLRIPNNSHTNTIPKIRMRGDDNTIVLVDGVRYDASILNILNPADIESVKVSNHPAAQNYFINQ